MARKTKKTSTLFARLKPANKKFVAALARRKKLTQGTLVDKIFSNLRSKKSATASL